MHQFWQITKKKSNLILLFFISLKMFLLPLKITASRYAHWLMFMLFLDSIKYLDVKYIQDLLYTNDYLLVRKFRLINDIY